MSAANNDYLPKAQDAAFPADLALLIVRKAEKMAIAFEDKALKQMKRDAQKALSRGIPAYQIAREMEL